MSNLSSQEATGLVVGAAALILTALILVTVRTVHQFCEKLPLTRNLKSIHNIDQTITTSRSDSESGSQTDGTTNHSKSTRLPSSFQLPFHLSLFEDVPVYRRVLFIFWMISVGPIVLLLRMLVMTVVFSITGPLEGFKSWMHVGVFNWFIESDCRGPEKLPNDGRPIVFLMNHHVTYDMGIVSIATRHRFGMIGKSMMHPKVYNNGVFRLLWGSKRHEFGITSDPNNKSTRFLDIFHDWIDRCNNKCNSCSQEAMIVAPAGMTTHERFITPMYWEYFASPGVVKVLVNVDVMNPFGVRMRSLMGNTVTSELLFFMMPWVTGRVTYYTDVISDDAEEAITCQDQVDEIVSRVFKENHGKEFAPGWTQKRRRKIDKYLKKGDFTSFPIAAAGSETLDAKEIGVIGDFSEELKSRLASDTKVVTSSLISNKALVEVGDIQASQVAVVNPKTKADEILAAVYDIAMATSQVSRLNATEASISQWCQRALDISVLNVLGKLLHYTLLEKNLILLAMLLLGSGLWWTQLLLLAQMTALAHIWLLLLKIMVQRPRPVWLPTHFAVKSLVDNIQPDGSFPSGHTGFLVLIASTALHEPDIFSLTARVILAVIAGVTAIERVNMGAHFASDVLVGVLYGDAFVTIFYAAGGDQHLLYRVTSLDLEFQVRVTVVLVSIMLAAIFLVNLLSREVSPLNRSTFFQNNLQRLSESQREKLLDHAVPFGQTSQSLLAPYVAIAAVCFWAQPLLASIYVRRQYLPPTSEILGVIRFFGSMTALAFILVLVLPLRKLADSKLKRSPTLLMLAHVVIYMLMLVFTTFYCHFLIQGMVVLTEDEP